MRIQDFMCSARLRLVYHTCTLFSKRGGFLCSPFDLFKDHNEFVFRCALTVVWQQQL